MLMSAQTSRYAHKLLAARANAQQVPRISEDPALSLADAYDIAKNILDVRIAQGEVPVGRKIGFTNRALWPKHEATQAIWAPMFDTTVRYTENNHGLQSLAGAVQPRIEPEIIFELGKTPPPGADLETIAGCIEWVAHGFEIVVSPFADWEFNAVDAVAAFGLHGSLIMGEPKLLSAASRRNLAMMLAASSTSLSCRSADSHTLVAAGFGSDVLDSPVHALWHLHQMLQAQPQFSPLAAGEIIATGSWTNSYPIEAGQTWSSAFSGVTLPGLTVSFV
jgi:2-keto-4-pentenoate hydratase